MKEKIKKMVAYYVRKYDTNDPFVLADYLNIVVLFLPLDDIGGFYKYMKRRKYVIINTDLDDNTRRVVMAHELGHALLHQRENCCFMMHHTLLLASKLEIQANVFAAELLVTEDLFDRFSGYTVEQFAIYTGFPVELIALKINDNN